MLGSVSDLNRAALVDTLEDAGLDLGSFDYQVLGQLAHLLDPVSCAVVVSWFERLADAVPD